jgi:hypothetical protein
MITSDDQGRFALNAMTASTANTPGYTDLTARCADMERVGLARQLLTFPGALGHSQPNGSHLALV